MKRALLDPFGPWIPLAAVLLVAFVLAACHGNVGVGFGDPAPTPAEVQGKLAAGEKRIEEAKAVEADPNATDAEKIFARQWREKAEDLKREIALEMGMGPKLGPIPLPKGLGTTDLIAWILGTNGVVDMVLGFFRKKRLTDLVKQFDEHVAKWDARTKMTIEDAEELQPLLKKLAA